MKETHGIFLFKESFAINDWELKTNKPPELALYKLETNILLPLFFLLLHDTYNYPQRPKSCFMS